MCLARGAFLQISAFTSTQTRRGYTSNWAVCIFVEDAEDPKEAGSQNWLNMIPEDASENSTCMCRNVVTGLWWRWELGQWAAQQ